MATAMKKRRQLRALERLPDSPYQGLGLNPTKEQVAKAMRLGKERESLISSLQK